MHIGSIFDAENDSTILPTDQLQSFPVEPYVAGVSPTTSELDDLEDLPDFTMQEPGFSEADGTALLVKASKVGDEFQVRLLLDRGVSVFTDLALVAAVQGGHDAVVRLLLDRGAPLTSGSALNAALRAGNRAMVQLLMGQGATLPSGFALMRAVRAGNNAQVEQNLDEVLCMHGNQPRNPLCVVARKRLEAEVELLLDRGARTSLYEVDRYLLAAAEFGLEAVVKLLLDRGAPMDGKTYGNPLLAAAKNGHKAVVQLLLDRGAPMDGKTYGNPLLAAAKNGHKAVVQLLLDRGAPMDGKIYGNPLLAAARNGHKAVVQLLLDRGALINGDYYETPLLAAATNGHRAVVQLLLDRGALINGPLYSHALLAAANGGHETVVQLLLHQYIATNDLWFMVYLDDGKSSQLIIRNAMVAAAILGRMSALLRFVRKAVEIDTVTQFGTALSAAAKHGNVRIVRWLLRKGADVNLAALLLQTSGNAEQQVADMFAIASSLRNSKYVDEEKQPPRTLERTHKLRGLRRKFIGQHVLMASKAEGSSTKFRELSRQYKTYRDTWKASIEAVRKLNRGERPNLANVIAYLCLAKAIQETLHDTGSDDYTEPFFKDLVRWQLIFEQNSDRDAYRDVVYSMWGVVLDDDASTEGQVDAEVTIRFQELASTLISHASDQFGHAGFSKREFERSQQAWHLRNNQISSDSDVTQDISILPVAEGIGEEWTEALNAEHPHHIANAAQSSLQDRIGEDTSPLPDHVVIFLMFGALFAIVVVFLQRSFPPMILIDLTGLEPY